MNKIESGTIFKFNLPYGFGVAYAKLLDFSYLSLYYGITLKIYDYFDSDEIGDVNFFKNVPLFMNPIPIVKLPSLKGKFAWKKIGILKEPEDAIIPIYKEYVHEGFAWETLEEYENREWYALVNLKEKIGPINFNKVRHLEELFWRSTLTIEKRVVMQLLRYKGIDVKDFFIQNSPDNSWLVDFNTQQFVPLYKNLPDPIKGKPLIKDFVPDEYLDWSW